MAVTELIRHRSDDSALSDILALLRRAFSGMDGRIDPPSSVLRLTLDDIRSQCETGEVWSIGPPPLACMFLTPTETALCIGKLAVDPDHQANGLARRLVACAEERCRAHGKPWLELQTRVELTENHLAFSRLGFVVTGRTAHPGYDRPTSLTFRKVVARKVAQGGR